MILLAGRSDTNLNQNSPSITSLLSGNFVVAWQSRGQDGSGDGVFGQLFDGNGSKIGNEFQVNTYTNRYQWLPSITCLNNGNFVVTWASDGQDGSSYGIFGQLFSGNGSKIGNEFQVNTYTNSSQTYPSVTNLRNGNFVVTWSSYGQDGSAGGVFSQLFDGNATSSGNEFQVNTYINNSQVLSSVADFNNGNFVVTWTSYSQTGSGCGIFGQLFDGNATPIENEFQVNTNTISNHSYSSVATFINDDFVVTWTSYGQDGSGSGVFGQLFSAIPITSNTDTSTTFTTFTPSTSTFTSSTRFISLPSSFTLSSPTTSATFTTSATSISTLLRSTLLTSSSSSYTLSSPAISTSPKASSPKRTRLVTIISLGVGGLICFCVTPLARVYDLQKNDSRFPSRS